MNRVISFGILALPRAASMIHFLRVQAFPEGGGIKAASRAAALCDGAPPRKTGRFQKPNGENIEPE
jgi:hypothetical protein